MYLINRTSNLSTNGVYNLKFEAANKRKITFEARDVLFPPVIAKLTMSAMCVRRAYG